MLFARLKPYAEQKYDMKVFNDDDSIKLAETIQTILNEAGWVYTNVYPKLFGERYAEAHNDGVFTISSETETRKASEARMALRGALHDAGLYDDSSLISPEGCAEIIGPIEAGSKITQIPCLDSPIQFVKFDFTVRDDIIPDDILVLHVGRERKN